METAYLHVNDGSEEDSAGDRLSLLPDDVLLEVIKHLDLRTIVRISALSRRWRHIPRSLSTIKIDAYDLTPRDATLRTLDQDEVMKSYAAVTRWLLPYTTQRVITKLYLGFYLKDPYLQSVGDAVEDVAKRGTVADLQITIWTGVAPDDVSDEQLVSFGHRFMSFFDACPMTFRWLTSLTLENQSFSKSAMPALFKTCVRLRILVLRNCDSGPSSALEIDAPHSQLLALELQSCRYPTVELIQVPQLERLSCDTWYDDNPPIHLGYVPRLHTVSLASAYLDDWQHPFLLSDWLTNARNISVMRLDFRNDKLWVKPEGPKQLFHVFTVLREVYLHNIFQESDLNWTLFFLEAAPFLKNLYIKISRHICNLYRCVDNAEDKTNIPWETSNFEHRNLRFLQIEGFAVEKKVMRYVRLVIQHAVNLKRIRLLAQERCKKCDATINRMCHLPATLRFPVQEREKNLYRERLTDGLSSSVDISIG